MAALTQIRTRIVNPIEWQETRHQEFTIPVLARHYGFLLPLMLALVIGLVALTLRDFAAPTRDLAIYVIWIVHAITAARAISAGANAISREHVGKTWDSLVLTGISTRQIVLGKWLGVLHRVAPWMLMLGVVRLAMLPILMLGVVNRFAWFTLGQSMSSSGFYYGPISISWVPWAAVAAVVLSVLLTVLEVLACTALGLAASALTRKGWLAMIAAICIRFTPVVIFAAFTQYEVGSARFGRLLRFPYLALADGGSAPLYQLVLPYTPRTQTAHIEALPSLGMVMLLLLAFIVVSMAVTWWSVRTAGALPEPSR